MANTKLVLILGLLAIGVIQVTSADDDVPADCVTPFNDCINQPEITKETTDQNNCYRKCGYCKTYDNTTYLCTDASYTTCKTGCDTAYNNSAAPKMSAECQITYSQCMKDNPSCEADYEECLTDIGDPLTIANNDSTTCSNNCWNNFCTLYGNGTYIPNCWQFQNYTDCTTTCQANFNATKAAQAQYDCSVVQNTCNFGCTLVSDRCTCACDDKFPEDQGGNAKCKVTCQNQLSTCSWIEDYTSVYPPIRFRD